MKVLDRRWQAPGDQGEAGIIGLHRGMLIVCEVRIVTAASGDGITRMSTAKIRRLRRIAVVWMDAHGTRYDRVRVDAIGIVREGPGGYTITHAVEVG